MNQETKEAEVAEATELYNEACELMLDPASQEAPNVNGPASTADITDLLQRSKDIITNIHTKESPFPGATSCVLLARSCVLLGQLIEWKDSAAALENYKTAVAIDPSNPEAYVQLGRCIWKQATSNDELMEVENYLRDAIALCEEVECDQDQEEGPDPTFSEANNLLARLLSQLPGREAETRTFLASIGYKYTLSNWLTSSAVTPSMEDKRITSKRLQNSNVCAFDSILPHDMLHYMQRTFATDSPFWPEHAYDSPTSGFFSYQLPLVEPHVREKSQLTSFESVVHHIWDTAKQGMPKLKDAKYAEWWCHSRPHCNGHKLHYDFVTDHGTSPRFPIASTVSFITADCGGPTLITDQQVNATSPLTHHGWLVRPSTNRLVCFNGSLLHCVLPGQGPSPAVDARRVTFMIAFWEEDPRAPPTPTWVNKSESKKGGGAKGSIVTWPKLLSQPFGMDNSFDKGSNKRKMSEIEDSDSDHTATLNNKAVTLVDPVVEVLEEFESDISNETRIALRRKVKMGVDLLDDDVFTYFEALNSGLVLSEKGICSLNCGGTCAMCSQLSNGTK